MPKKIKHINSVKSIKAFTIIEIIVALIISALVISLAYILLMNSEIYFDKLKEQSSHSIRYIDFYSTLKNDIHQCNSVSTEQNEIILSFDQHKITYRIEDNFVERSIPNKETSKFNVVIEDIEVKYLKNTKLVNEIILKIHGTNLFEVNYLKQYSNQTLVKEKL